MQESYNRHTQTDVLMGGAVMPGGGSKSKSKRKKQLLQKPSTTDFYKRLAETK